MADSEERTGRKILQEIPQQVILECIVEDDVREMYATVMEILRTGDNKEKLSAARLILEYSVPKPAQSVDVTSDGDKIEAGIFVPGGFDNPED